MSEEIRLGDDARIDDFKCAVIKTIQEAKLPLYVVEYVIADVHQALTRDRIEAVKHQREIYKKKTAPETETKVARKSGTKEEFLEYAEKNGIKVTKLNTNTT